MIHKLISSKAIIEKVYRDFNQTEEGNWVSMIEWIGEAIEEMNCFNSFEKLTAKLKVKDYKAALPCNFYSLIDLSFCGTPVEYMTGTFDYVHSDSTIKTIVPGYTMNAGYLNFSIRDGEVDISYLGIPTDEEGFPMIPDHSSVREACYRYIIWKLNYPQYVTGQINMAIYKDMEYQWVHYCRQACATISMPDVRQMASIGKSFQSLVQHINRSNVFFRNYN